MALLFLRIVAVLGALVAWAVVFMLGLLVAVYFMANDEERSSDGTWEFHTGSFPQWVVWLWWAGVIAVVWFVGFRVRWWRSR